MQTEDCPSTWMEWLQDVWASFKMMVGPVEWCDIAGVVIGGVITLLVSWLFYARATRDLKREAEQLRKVSSAALYKLQHPDADVDFRFEDKYVLKDVIVRAAGRASGKSTARGVGADIKDDS